MEVKRIHSCAVMIDYLLHSIFFYVRLNLQRYKKTKGRYDPLSVYVTAQRNATSSFKELFDRCDVFV